MKIDLHIHTVFSDGKINIAEESNDFFSNYNLISITDHEHIFNPQDYDFSGVRLISGVEICCNHCGVNIEILGYRFNPNDDHIRKTVQKVKDLRIAALKSLFAQNDFNNVSLTENPFRCNTALPHGIDSTAFWSANNKQYKQFCHATPASDVIAAIAHSGGIPVFAHPMESLRGMEEHLVSRFILSLGIETVEVFTPKHSDDDVKMLTNIILSNHLSASIGSDSHGFALRDVRHRYNIMEPYFEWLNQLMI